MVFIKDDGTAAPELVPDRWGFYKQREEPQAEELGIKQKQVWEPGWRIINERERIKGLGITEEDIKERWWAQERLKTQGVEMPKAPKDHLNRLRTKGIDLFAEPRGSRYSLGAPPPYVTNPPEGSPLWEELQKFKRGEPSFYDTTKVRAPASPRAPRAPRLRLGRRAARPFAPRRETPRPRRRSRASAKVRRGSSGPRAKSPRSVRRCRRLRPTAAAGGGGATAAPLATAGGGRRSRGCVSVQSSR